MFPKLMRPDTLALRGRGESMTSSGEGTPTNLSSPSSGRSTPSFRKKPKRPEIKLSDRNKQYMDYIEILRAESMQSLHAEPNCDAENSDLSSGVEISEEMIAKAFLSSHMKNDLNDDSVDGRMASTSSGSLESYGRLKTQKLCMQRPSSPVSQFMIPLLEAENQDTILTDIYDKLSPVLNQLKSYDEQSKQLSTLQVKIAVLQEEKRQLSTLLKEKRERENIEIIDNKETRDIGVQKTLEIVTEINHSSSQTERPADKHSVKIGGDSPAEIYTIEKGIQEQVSTKENSCQREAVKTSECSTETITSSTREWGTDPKPTETSSIACQQDAVKMSESSTETFRLSTQESGTDPKLGY